MLIWMKENNIRFDNNFGHEKWHYDDGLKNIESVIKNLEERGIAEEVLNNLKAIENFWSENYFYYDSEDCEPLMILKNELVYFEDARRKKYADCEEKVQQLFDKLKEYLIDENDIELIMKVNKSIERRDEAVYRNSETITTAEFLDDIDCEIGKWELLDKYTGSDHEKEISIYKFVKDMVTKFGVSDSYAAQVLYKEMENSLKGEYDYEDSDDMPGIILELEMYRCIAKQSTATRDELLTQFLELSKGKIERIRERIGDNIYDNWIWR